MSEYIEEVYKAGLRFGLRSKAKLFSGKSPFQSVDVYRSTDHGAVLLNDGCFMLSERDERIYHEMMAHVPLFVHPSAKNVLIVGGGDGGTAREVLRHKNIERCVLVEIDEMVVNACHEHIPQTAAVFTDPRLELKIEDGVKFTRESTEKFDVIMIDSTDPEGAAQPLFGKEFYADVAARLGDNGIVIAQGESVFYEAEMQKTLLSIAAEKFAVTSMYNFTNMTYPGGLWSFMWASKGLHPLHDVRVQEGIPMFYYNSALHKAAFQLPQFQAEALKPWTKL